MDCIIDWGVGVDGRIRDGLLEWMFIGGGGLDDGGVVIGGKEIVWGGNVLGL